MSLEKRVDRPGRCPFSLWAGAVLAAGLAAFAPAASAQTSSYYYNIAHMTNTPDAVDWALGSGANAIEADLMFDGNGQPVQFKHGRPCDCTCYCPPGVRDVPGTCSTLYPNSVCAQLQNSSPSPCDAATPSAAFFAHLARKTALALVIVDSKVERSMGSAVLGAAGNAVVDALDRQLFAKGYRGSVIVSAPKIDTLPYLQAAAQRALLSPNAARIYFSIDGETSNFAGVVNALISLPSARRVYGTGISACAPFASYYPMILQAWRNQNDGVLGLVYIWTLDKASSMRTYLDYGARGIMTNFPSIARDVLSAAGHSLATPETVIPVATNSTITDIGSHICDCNYHAGGCSISRAAPAGLACRCEYVGFWTCGGYQVACRDASSPFCKVPDTSELSCVQGGGDCGGYQSRPCDCDYHPGGCSLSKAPPANTACQCVYKGAWTCGGWLVPCYDPSSPYCQRPDTSLDSCLQGGGDCQGYQNLSCDCDYHPGGCSIRRAAPANTACQCSYKGGWTCGGEIVRCKNPDSPYCLSPDQSIRSCFQGGGDCQGYNEASCDCDYRSGGCTISKAPPSTTACQCKYKGFWTCGGSIVPCGDGSSPYCLNPDRSKATCLLGGGDCGGY